MLDITKYGKFNKINEVDPKTTFFVAFYNNKVVEGTGLDVTGWDALENGIVRLAYRLSTGKTISVPKYKAYVIFIEASISIDKDGGLNNKNYHYVYIKGMGDKLVHVHKVALRTNPILNENIGDVKLYTEPIPSEIISAWKWSI